MNFMFYYFNLNYLFILSFLLRLYYLVIHKLISIIILQYKVNNHFLQDNIPVYIHSLVFIYSPHNIEFLIQNLSIKNIKNYIQDINYFLNNIHLSIEHIIHCLNK
mmetsp:Transcript_12825/g.1143  ORF Transcript_12825/g.1143 Transcript_12825/m.1143 type:complete len:105 (-) Transcript_12825:37-351(-)